MDTAASLTRWPIPSSGRSWVADLEIGGYFTPDGILSAMERLPSAGRQLSLETHDVLDIPPELEDAWDAFTQEFLAWKADHTSWLSRAWDTTRDELTGDVERFPAPRGRWAAVPPATAAPSLNVTSDTIGSTLADAGKSLGVALQSVGIGLAVIVGVGIAAYVVWKAAA